MNKVHLLRGLPFAGVLAIAPGTAARAPGAPLTIPVPEDIALQGTYLNDIRFSPDGRTGYITDSGTRGAIIVVDLDSGKGFRALDGHPSTQVDKTVTVMIDGKPLKRPDGRQPVFSSDSIAISNDGKTLYYQVLTGKTLYSIDTAKLRPDVSEQERAAAVKTVATTHVADGLWDEQGRRALSHLAERLFGQSAGRRWRRNSADGQAAALAGHVRRGARRTDLRDREPHPRHDLVHPRCGGIGQDRVVLLRARAELKRKEQP